MEECHCASKDLTGSVPGRSTTSNRQERSVSEQGASRSSSAPGNYPTPDSHANARTELLSMVLHSLVGQCTEKQQICIEPGSVAAERLQEDLYRIIEKSDCTAVDVERFSTTLNYLVAKCGYMLKAAKPSLLQRAAEADNMPIVLKLLLSHNVHYSDINREDWSTILHIACQLKSALRYIYVLAFPNLLTVPDNNGYCPIHIACQKNDLQFISWLFKSVLCKEEVPSTTVSIGTSFIEANVAPDATPPLSSVKLSKFSATSATGQSVYHIAVSNGLFQLLSLLLDILGLMHDDFEVNVVLAPDGDNTTALDMAISNKQLECVRLLLEFLNKHGMLQKVVQDGRFVKCAANVGDANIMKLLVKYGFSQGLEEAIGKVQDQQLKRLLLYYYTQLTSAKAIMETQSDYKKGLTAGQIKWSAAPIKMFSVTSINDWFQAIESISHAINQTEVPLESLCGLHTIQYLAAQCLSYFENGKLCRKLLDLNPLVPITVVDITSCSLKYAPPELFQLPKLKVLKLSNNCIQELPTALHSSQCIYSSESLKKLLLDGNKLNTLPEDLFLGLVNSLEHLSVQKNELTELPPGLWVMPHLKELNLSNNKLSQLHYFSESCISKNPEFTKLVLEALEYNSSLCEFESSSNGSTILRKADSDKYSEVNRYLQRLKLFYHILNKATGGKFVLENFKEWICFLNQQSYTQEGDDSSPFKLGSNVILNEEITENLSVISSLDISHNMFTKVPIELPCLVPNLQRLHMSYNRIKTLNLVCCMPSKVECVHLDNNNIENVAATYSPLPHCLSPCMLLQPHPLSITGCSHTAHNDLVSLVNLQLGYNKLKDFTSTNLSGEMCNDLDSIVVSIIVHFPQLSILSLEHNELTSVPPSILNLTSLNSLILAHNTGIVSLPSRLGLLSLSTLNLEGLSLEGIPINLIEHKSAKYLLGYLKGIYLGKEVYRHMKLMFVGSANAGKTTLLLQLTKKGSMVHQRIVQKGVDRKPLSTVGVELGEWEYSPKMSSPKVTFVTWDFGGQEEYYATHQCFISHRSLYLVVWDARDGEAGLRSIKTWLENIEAQAHNAPVIVIGTHADCIRNTSALGEAFKRLYVEYNPSSFAYPKIQSHCFFVNSFSTSDVQQLRRYIYEFTRMYKHPGAGKDATPILDEPIPSYYMHLLQIIKSWATTCNLQNISPIFTKKEYIDGITQYKFRGTVQDIVEASSFWHDNGIIFHHKGITMEELYCIDPQWLCAMLAKVVTVREKNPFHKNGFMHQEDFTKLYSLHQLSMGTIQTFIGAIISIMQSFEVILLLDQHSILIPSLMSQQRKDACAITADNYGKLSVHSDIGHVITPITTQKDVLMRHYILPFVPNGFFSRLISRVCASRIIDACKGMFGAFNPWWSCWRDGVCLICNDAEILRIVHVTYPLPGTEAMYMVTSSGNEVVTRLSGIEVRVVIKSKIYALPISAKKPVGATSDPLDPICAATWLLQQAIECIDSIFDDWYVTFGRKRGFELSTIQQGSPCTECETRKATSTQAAENIRGRRYYLFSSQYCAHAAASRQALVCPIHGCASVSHIAPDLVFGDLPHSMIYNAGAITTGDQLGQGAFGSVFSGNNGRNRIAIKTFGGADHFPTSVESLAWEKYQQISREARVICRLVHDNILGLVGVATAPLMLLLELAPLGDLKRCLQKFQQLNIKLNVQTIKSTLVQVAKALDYIHSKKFIFRDLKPGNILVWKYPLPETQWNSDSEVYLKLADYGICQQYTPQGVRGVDGTPPYLPPEAILLDGQQSQNTKLDVYSFGMLMYYLVTFDHPFQNTSKPLSALLLEGKRPTLSFKQCPPSLWLLELMCWCWSEHPYHRPDIKEVLTVLADGVTSQLVSAFPIASYNPYIAAACSRCIPKGQHSLSLSSSLSLSTSFRRVHFKGTPGYIYPLGYSKLPKHLSEQSLSLDIWCACKDGLQRVSCQAFNCAVEYLDTVECTAILSTPHDQIWVSKALSTGGEITIYDAKRYHKIGAWHSDGTSPVRKLLYNAAEDVIVAITGTAIHVFSHHYGTENLNPAISHTIADDVTEAVLVDVAEKGCKLSLWYSVTSKLKVLKLSPSKTNCKIINHDESSTHAIRHMEALWEEEGTKLNHIVLSHGSCIEKWAVESKELQTTCKCYDFCCHLYGNNYDKSKVTAFLYWKDILYVGTVGGVMIALNPVDMTALWAIQASETPIRLLLGALLNPKEERKPHRTQPPTLQGPSDSVEEDKPNVGPNRDQVQPTSSNTPRSLVISFGERYTGVFKGSSNVPPSLVPPGEPHSNTDHPPCLKLSTAPSCVTHMFLWSTTCSDRNDSAK